MNRSDALYQLINSLKKTEKRYFRLFANTNRAESNLLRLFDAIAIKRYKNDREVKENYSGHSFIKNLDVLKVHLQKLILQSMRLYHQNSNKERELKNMIIDIEFLMQRCLFSQCEKLIKKAKAIAIAVNLNPALMDILELEKRFIALTFPLPTQIRKLDEIYQQENGILKKLIMDSEEKQAVMKEKMQPPNH